MKLCATCIDRITNEGLQMVDADSNQFAIVVDVALLSQHQNCSMKIILWTSACYVEALLSGKHTAEIMLRSLKL